MDINILIVVSLFALVLSAVTAFFSILSYCKVVGMEKSTHQVQWVPVDNPSIDEDDDLTRDQDEFEEQLRKRDQEVYKKFSKMYPDVELEQV